ncbi:sensor histidine kinase [Thioalkalivibrio paradoxus]|uniref:Histidine kinase n=1 Tax=Thioalkalivibrio paradoxus ARh 1 TaxID=713585 RepID=W0DK79_9GAMM|nr:histidine kinase [Thioalkalivibrio paradoxus]AHE97290.1 histidine kinase [Thioalkalivibrio paradoxus ARh 1]
MERSETTRTGERTPAIATPVLPDFCSGETVLRTLMLVVPLSLVVVLLQGREGDPLLTAAPVLIFMAWVAFTSLLLLCAIQSWLRTRGLLLQVSLPTLLPVVNTALVHLGAEQVMLADSHSRLRVIAVAALLSVIATRYFYLIAAWQQETRMVAQAREQALRARVRPHFLFNSMNTIASLCRSDPARAEQVTLDLADLFRVTFATGADHPLATELDLVHAYLAIEQTRFGDRLLLEWDVPDHPALNLRVPSLVLLPLVENAIQHGIAPERQGGCLWIKVQPGSRWVSIRIGNTVGENTGRGTGTAGAEARARLKHCFGSKARVEVTHKTDTFEATVTLPLTQENSDTNHEAAHSDCGR